MNSPKGHASKLPYIVVFMEKMPDDDDDYGDYDDYDDDGSDRRNFLNM